MENSRLLKISESEEFEFRKTILLIDTPSHSTEIEVGQKIQKVLNRKIEMRVLLSRLPKKITNEGFGYIELKEVEMKHNLLELKGFKMKKNSVKIVSPTDYFQVRKNILNLVERELFVSDLPKNIVQDDIFKYFGQFGAIEEIEFGKNHRTKKMLGFVTIRFAHKSSVSKILAQNDHFIGNQKIKCTKKLSQAEIDNSRPLGTSKYSEKLFQKLRLNLQTTKGKSIHIKTGNQRDERALLEPPQAQVITERDSSNFIRVIDLNIFENHSQNDKEVVKNPKNMAKDCKITLSNYRLNLCNEDQVMRVEYLYRKYVKKLAGRKNNKLFRTFLAEN